MNLQIYEKDKFFEMDSMHDSIATNISIKDKTLIITYDNLNEGVMGRDGLPYYKNKRLTIEYVIDSYCDAKFFRKNKYKYVDLLEEKNKFYKLTNSCSFMSSKYAIDSFGEIILFFNIREKNKYFSMHISKFIFCREIYFLLSERDSFFSFFSYVKNWDHRTPLYDQKFINY